MASRLRAKGGAVWLLTLSLDHRLTPHQGVRFSLSQAVPQGSFEDELKPPGGGGVGKPFGQTLIWP